MKNIVNQAIDSAYTYHTNQISRQVQNLNQHRDNHHLCNKQKTVTALKWKVSLIYTWRSAKYHFSKSIIYTRPSCNPENTKYTSAQEKYPSNNS